VRGSALIADVTPERIKHLAIAGIGELQTVDGRPATRPWFPLAAPGQRPRTSSPSSQTPAPRVSLSPAPRWLPPPARPSGEGALRAVNARRSYHPSAGHGHLKKLGQRKIPEAAIPLIVRARSFVCGIEVLPNVLVTRRFHRSLTTCFFGCSAFPPWDVRARGACASSVFTAHQGATTATGAVSANSSTETLLFLRRSPVSATRSVDASWWAARADKTRGAEESLRPSLARSGKSDRRGSYPRT
jgi:hypothetical protein